MWSSRLRRAASSPANPRRVDRSPLRDTVALDLPAAKKREMQSGVEPQRRLGRRPLTGESAIPSGPWPSWTALCGAARGPRLLIGCPP
jgi:hypothetical protein